MVWLYVGIALVAAAATFFLGRLIRARSVKTLMGAWVCLLTGAGFFLIYAVEGDRNLFDMAIAVTIFVTGLVALWRVTRLTTGTGGEL